MKVLDFADSKFQGNVTPANSEGNLYILFEFKLLIISKAFWSQLKAFWIGLNPIYYFLELLFMPRCQFCQRYSWAFFVQTLFQQLFSSYVWLGDKIWYEKNSQKTLMKLTSYVSLLELVAKMSTWKFYKIGPRL